MFGIDDALIWAPLAGAVVGGLTNKRNPLAGAAMGGLAGYTSGALMAPGGALAGAIGNPATAAAYGTGIGSQQTAMLAAQDAGMAEGLLGTTPKTALAGLKDVGNAASAANSVNGLLSPKTPQVQAAPVIQSVGGAGSLMQLVGSNQQAQQQAYQDELTKRAKRRAMWG